MISIPHVPFKAAEKAQPLSWRHGKRDGAATVNFVCKCGRTAPLRQHTIADDGTVTPSVWDWEGCGFHDHLKLEDYP